MPLQNRVTPFGDLVAHPSRASLFVGNRGIIHDPATRTLTGRRWTTRSWIDCACSFKDRNRTPIWMRNSWTELFFLDEATALAAGHRPCFECRRDAARAFAAAWAKGNGTDLPRAGEMDAALHGERLYGRGRRLHPPDAAALPDGAIVAAGDAALLAAGSRWFRWDFDGYTPTGALARIEGVLTPPSTLGALRGGYRPELHPTAA